MKPHQLPPPMPGDPSAFSTAAAAESWRADIEEEPEVPPEYPRQPPHEPPEVTPQDPVEVPPPSPQPAPDWAPTSSGKSAPPLAGTDAKDWKPRTSRNAAAAPPEGVSGEGEATGGPQEQAGAFKNDAALEGVGAGDAPVSDPTIPPIREETIKKRSPVV